MNEPDSGDVTPRRGPHLVEFALSPPLRGRVPNQLEGCYRPRIYSTHQHAGLLQSASALSADTRYGFPKLANRPFP